MQVPLLDLKGQYQGMKEEILKEIAEVCDSQHFILGPKVEKLEAEAAAYCHSKYSVGVTSGSDALIIALMSKASRPVTRSSPLPSPFLPRSAPSPASEPLRYSRISIR